MYLDPTMNTDKEYINLIDIFELGAGLFANILSANSYKYCCLICSTKAIK